MAVDKEQIFDSFETSLNLAKDRIIRKQNGESFGYTTRFKSLNESLGGEVEFGQNVVIAARTGVGKSAFGNIILMDFCQLNPHINKAIFYWNLEMTNCKQAFRFLSFQTGKSVNDLKAGKVPIVEVDEAIKLLKDYPIFLSDDLRKSSFIKRSNIRYKAENPNTEIVNLIDHTRLVTKENIEKEEEMLFNLMMDCNEIKKSCGSLNIILSQLNRSIESSARMTQYPIPMSSDIFGADAIGQTADVILMPFRPEMYNIPTLYYGGVEYDTKQKIFCNIAKSREGELVLLNFTHDLAINQINDSVTKQ